MWSLFGYAVIFVVVIIVLHQLWFMRKFLFAILILGTVGYFITNFVLRNKDMSEGNVKKTTKIVYHTIKNGIEKTTSVLQEWNGNSVQSEPGKKLEESKSKPESEGFVTE